MEPLEWLTLGLLAVTAYYAVQTHLTLRELRRQHEAERQMWSRDKSEAAARACHDAATAMSELATERGPLILRERARPLTATLRSHGPLVRDELVRDRIAATAEVLFVASFPNAQMERENLSPGRLEAYHSGESYAD